MRALGGLATALLILVVAGAHRPGAAGAVEAVATLLALADSTLPATINYGEEDPDCELDCIPDGPREAPGLEFALSNSFGFGGQNACLVLAKE